MHVRSHIVFRKAHSLRRMRIVDNATDRLISLDLLAFHPDKLRKASAFAHSHKVKSRRLSCLIDFGFDDKILKLTMRLDAIGKRLDMRFAMRHRPRISRRPFEFVQRNEHEFHIFFTDSHWETPSVELGQA
jgi:hypothetical protein